MVRTITSLNQTDERFGDGLRLFLTVINKMRVWVMVKIISSLYQLYERLSDDYKTISGIYQ